MKRWKFDAFAKKNGSTPVCICAAYMLELAALQVILDQSLPSFILDYHWRLLSRAKILRNIAIKPLLLPFPAPLLRVPQSPFNSGFPCPLELSDAPCPTWLN